MENENINVQTVMAVKYANHDYRPITHTAQQEEIESSMAFVLIALLIYSQMTLKL
jgi:hypothetical protein